MVVMQSGACHVHFHVCVVARTECYQAVCYELIHYQVRL